MTDFIQPVQEEIDHPFVMVPRDLIRNPNISPECKWFISYLLSHSGNWKIRIPYIIKSQKISKNRIYPIINEAIEAGYVKREDYLEAGKKRYTYFVSREPKFKKCLLCPQNQDTENQDTENEDTKEYQSSSYEEEKDKKEIVSLVPTPNGAETSEKTFSSKSSEEEEGGAFESKKMSVYLFDKVKSLHPKLKDPKLDSWAKDLSLLHRKERP